MSTNTGAAIYRVKRMRGGKQWFLTLEDYDYDYQGLNTWKTYGPFESKEKAEEYLSNNFANPGGMMNFELSLDEHKARLKRDGRKVITPIIRRRASWQW